MRGKKTFIICILFLTSCFIPLRTTKNLKETPIPSDLQTDWRNPTERWQYETGLFSVLGSPYLIDLDGDLIKEIIILDGDGSIFCLNSLGQLLWNHDFGVTIQYEGGVAIGNLNEDNDLEIVVGGLNNFNLYCLDRVGNILWTYTTPNPTRAPTLADINNDSKQEILFTSYGGDLYCISNEGDLDWVRYGDFYSNPLICDIDLDGIMDIIVYDGTHTYCLDNLGFEKWSNYFGGDSTRYYSVGDLENDGVIEIIGTTQGRLECLNSTGSELWGIDFFDNSRALQPIIADLNNNGTKEVIVNVNALGLLCLSSKGNVIWNRTIIPYDRQISVVDIENDGFLDLVCGRDGVIYCYDYYGLYQWSYTFSGDFIDGAYYLSIADLDNDDKLEIVTNYLYAFSGNPFSRCIICVGFDGIQESGTSQWYCYLGSYYHTGQIDYDGDYLDEFTEEYFYKTSDNSTDSDSDTLNDGYEALYLHTDPSSNDTDLDLMPDNFEINYSFNPLDPADANDDPDTDNLLNFEEYLNNTNPLVSDTDSDGMPDGWEVYNNLNPNLDDSSGDPDIDNLNNYGEYQAGTNPHMNDTDSDTLPDGWEVTGGTNPLIDDSTSDPDGDNLSNLEEYGYNTNLTSSDSDGDNTPEDWEIANSFDPLIQDSDEDPDYDDLDNYNEYLHNTDPNVADTDADGLFDGAEVLTYNTNPLLNDTDGDGYLDGEEVVAGSDPLNKFSIPGDTPSSSSKWWISLIVLGAAAVIFVSTSFVLKNQGISFRRKEAAEPKMIEEPEKVSREETTCFYCGEPMQATDKSCNNCSSKILKCNTCKLPINFGDEISVCPLCGTIGHNVHLQEWVKSQGKCPHCLQKVSSTSLFIIDKPHAKKVDKKIDDEDGEVVEEKEIPKPKDHKHASLVEYMTHQISKEADLNIQTEYTYPGKYADRSIDLIAWKKEDNKLLIDLYEMKSAIWDIGNTIRQVMRYKNYLKGKKDPIFGAMENKDITTHLVLIDNKRNYNTFQDHFGTFLKSQINYIWFINVKKNEMRKIPIKEISKPKM